MWDITVSKPLKFPFPFQVSILRRESSKKYNIYQDHTKTNAFILVREYHSSAGISQFEH